MNATNVSGVIQTSFRSKTKGSEGEGETRRLIERLLLRLDFNGGFSKPRAREILDLPGGEAVLKRGG